ncbi:hypothetical protein KFK09_009884 [Dendrobium nobile]|uniref:Uncharacterized protein n=1 Tax=Dendrobium nobile TaxID=94219 RepID=A0A8T3BMR0_DENNO|nr:hypothetical protein KFK09_009884 [Dendrobium nobile]
MQTLTSLTPLQKPNRLNASQRERSPFRGTRHKQGGGRKHNFKKRAGGKGNFNRHDAGCKP